VPLLPAGERDLRRALFEAIAAGNIEIVDSAGETRTVTTAADINLGSSELRIQRPSESQVDVPNVTGQSVADARAALQQAGLTVATATAGTTGIVTEQDASPGARVDPGTAITLTLRPRADDPKPSPTEHQVALTVTRSLSDAEVREAIWRLFSTIADAIDDDTSHVQMTIRLTASTAAKDKIVKAAEAAGLPATVDSL